MKTYFDGSLKNEHKVLVKNVENRGLQQWTVFDDVVANSAGSDEEPSKIFDVYQEGSVLFIGQQFYLINKIGSCWDSEDSRGKFKMCIDTIYSSYALSTQMNFDSVYVYQKEYSQPDLTDSLYFNYYISLPKGLLIRTEKLRLTDTIYVEKIVSILDTEK